MPYKISILEQEGIIQTELIDDFSKEDISAYIRDLLNLNIYHKYGRLLVDYARAKSISADYNEINNLTDMMTPLQIQGREIWQAGINADPVFVGISRQANTLLEIKNQYVDRVNLRFFEHKNTAIEWLKSKVVS
ncbi:MAG: hypothetical protein KJO69_01585 [Gammaproteobacteria bacterium]|nr:hypothetical protein [Gammaproteobacteria bacterium]NNJ72192.1 hypothetical protein [Enterobacterales bacterium]